MLPHVVCMLFGVCTYGVCGHIKVSIKYQNLLILLENATHFAHMAWFVNEPSSWIGKLVSLLCPQSLEGFELY